MKPTDVLVEEHNAIKRMLAVTEAVCKRLEGGEAVEPEHLTEIVDFIKGFADRCHHAKEEDLLFPAMEEAGMPRAGGPIAVMLSEHEIGREFVRNMNDAASAFKGGDAGASARFVENARNYVALLTDHIGKEDNILYPMGNKVLTPENQEKLAGEFERVEHEVVGHGEHEKYMRVLENLESVYG